MDLEGEPAAAGGDLRDNHISLTSSIISPCLCCILLFLPCKLKSPTFHARLLLTLYPFFEGPSLQPGQPHKFGIARAIHEKMELSRVPS